MCKVFFFRTNQHQVTFHREEIQDSDTCMGLVPKTGSQGQDRGLFFWLSWPWLNVEALSCALAVDVLHLLST